MWARDGVPSATIQAHLRGTHAVAPHAVATPVTSAPVPVPVPPSAAEHPVWLTPSDGVVVHPILGPHTCLACGHGGFLTRRRDGDGSHNPTSPAAGVPLFRCKVSRTAFFCSPPCRARAEPRYLGLLAERGLAVAHPRKALSLHSTAAFEYLPSKRGGRRPSPAQLLSLSPAGSGSGSGSGSGAVAGAVPVPHDVKANLQASSGGASASTGASADGGAAAGAGHHVDASSPATRNNQPVPSGMGEGESGALGAPRDTKKKRKKKRKRVSGGVSGQRRKQKRGGSARAMQLLRKLDKHHRRAK